MYVCMYVCMCMYIIYSHILWQGVNHVEPHDDVAVLSSKDRQQEILTRLLFAPLLTYVVLWCPGPWNLEHDTIAPFWIWSHSQARIRCIDNDKSTSTSAQLIREHLFEGSSLSSSSSVPGPLPRSKGPLSTRSPMAFRLPPNRANRTYQVVHQLQLST